MKIYNKFKTLFKISRKPKEKVYPRGYSNIELGELIDKYGNLSANNPALGPSYFSKATLGLIELHGRGNSRISWISLFFAAAALIISAYGIQLSKVQLQFSEIETTSARILQARSKAEAIRKCKENPNMTESGLFNIQTGEPAPCSEVLILYK